MKPLQTSKVLGNECAAVARDLLRQPELLAGVFLDDEKQRLLPDQERRLEVTKQYTGERSTSDEERMLFVGALRMLGASDREIERVCGCTRRTIPLLLEELERTGRVTPLKDRLTKMVGDNAERSAILLRSLLDQAQDGIRDMDMAAMLKAVGQVNVFQVEKYQLLTGAATERIEQVRAAGREEIEDWLRRTAIPVEAQSTGSLEKPQEMPPVPAADTTDVTADRPEIAPDGGGGASAPGPTDH
jgi:hypothetical protein